MHAREHRRRLIRILRHAHAGERGAERAYSGHAASLSDPAERDAVLRIRQEELDHRAGVAAMLTSLSATPSRPIEWLMWLVGSSIGVFCRVGGWFAPMYGAAWLESRNIGEYEDAARHALGAELPDLVDELLTMAEVEWDHELYFREKAATHWMWRVFPHWEAPATRDAIRWRFVSDTTT